MELTDPPEARLMGSGDSPEDDADAYRELAADIASGVAVVATRERGHDVAATVTGYLDVSCDPPTMLVSLYGDGRIADAVQSAGYWTLSLLAADQQGIANWLASPGNPVFGLLNQVPFRRAPATGAVVVEGALAWFELRTVDTMQAATHLVVVGEVVSMGRGMESGRADDPLVHFASDYRGLRRAPGI
ncbi:flavin reductase family protein [Arthrobacter sp. KK5.5]|uniref:flavin reductase family protein n=1 Tax=Arthrobacter sp. KK5.5 TaxID=3373084 RepID=UPI003EE7F7D3